MLRWLPALTLLKHASVHYGPLCRGFFSYDHETHQYNSPNSEDSEKRKILAERLVTMATQQLQNGCIFAVFP